MLNTISEVGGKFWSVENDQWRFGRNLPNGGRMETMKEIGISRLYENGTVRQTLHPNFAITVDEVDTFSDVSACSFNYRITIDVWKLA